MKSRHKSTLAKTSGTPWSPQFSGGPNEVTPTTLHLPVSESRSMRGPPESPMHTVGLPVPAQILAMRIGRKQIW